MGADETYMTLITHGSYQILAPFKYVQTIKDLIQIMWEVFHCAHHLKCSVKEQYANLSGHTREYF